MKHFFFFAVLGGPIASPSCRRYCPLHRILWTVNHVKYDARIQNQLVMNLPTTRET